MDINKNILSRFPKSRPKLPPEYEAIYKEHYFLNREGQYKTTSLSQKLESWMHKQVARDVLGNARTTTLEIGAGTLNQLQYEPSVGHYDIVEPSEYLYKDSPHLKRIRNIFSDICEAKDSAPYDRITSVAAFEHILDLPVVVAQSAVLLNQNGHLRVAIPNEGTFLWKLGTMITGLEFKKKYGLDYQVLMRYEHVNTADEIENVIKFFFNTVKRQVFGITAGIGLYRFYDCSNPKLETAKDYLANPTGKP